MATPLTALAFEISYRTSHLCAVKALQQRYSTHNFYLYLNFLIEQLLNKHGMSLRPTALVTI